MWLLKAYWLIWYYGIALKQGCEKKHVLKYMLFTRSSQFINNPVSLAEMNGLKLDSNTLLVFIFLWDLLRKISVTMVRHPTCSHRWSVIRLSDTALLRHYTQERARLSENRWCEKAFSFARERVADPLSLLLLSCNSGDSVFRVLLIFQMPVKVSCTMSGLNFVAPLILLISKSNAEVFLSPGYCAVLVMDPLVMSVS